MVHNHQNHFFVCFRISLAHVLILLNYFLDAQGKQKYQPPNRSWMARHENRRRKSVDEEEDYDFKTKRQIVNEFEFAPETEENLDTLEGQSQVF